MVVAVLDDVKTEVADDDCRRNTILCAALFRCTCTIKQSGIYYAVVFSIIFT